MPSSSEQQPILNEELLKEHMLAQVPVVDNGNSNPTLPQHAEPEIEIFDDDNPGPSFEEVFPEFAYQDDEYQELEEGDLCEYYHAESDNCPCCQGFVYNCDGNFCAMNGVCECVGDKELQPHYFIKS